MKKKPNRILLMLFFALTLLGLVSPSSAKDYEDSHSSKIYDENWNFSFGIIGFFYLDYYNTGNQFIDTDEDHEGTLYGFRFSAGKGRSRIGLSIYTGEEEFDSYIKQSNLIERRKDLSNKRLDIDLAWIWTVSQREKTQWGYLIGLKYLNSDRTINESEYAVIYNEDNGSVNTSTDSKIFNADNEAYMGSLGLFGSFTPFGFRKTSLFGTFNFLLGAVDGEIRKVKDNSINGVIETVYESDTIMAWGLNLTFGVQYLLLDQIALQIGFRGQALNSTDSFFPNARGGKWYDSYSSIFGSIDYFF